MQTDALLWEVNMVGKYRHEIKLSINNFDRAVLSNRLSHLLSRDSYAGSNGFYVVRSIYFDDCDDNALQDKLLGVKYREKFRIRTYGQSLSIIKLEKKVKNNQVGYKDKALLSEAECRAVLEGNHFFLKERAEMVCRQLYGKMNTGLYKPRAIVQYNREAYVWEPGRVRITIDSDLQSGLNCVDFLNFNAPLTGVMAPGVSILEIKYDDFLPAHIAHLLQMESRQRAALSKYVISRRFN